MFGLPSDEDGQTHSDEYVILEVDNLRLVFVYVVARQLVKVPDYPIGTGLYHLLALPNNFPYTSPKHHQWHLNQKQSMGY